MGKMCLAMIVANEAPVIERCLNSMEHLIDRIYISINADEDGTQECIEKWGKAHGIETTVWFDPWNGYGPNKTRNLAKIRQEIATEYIIFIDADEVFVTDPANPTSYPTPVDAQRLFKELDSQPNMDVWHMKTQFGGVIYNRWQIIRNNQEWIWQLPYQEILEGQTRNNTSIINWIYNYARHEGHSSRHDDRRPNVERLEKWFRENPNTNYIPRVYYYLGEGYIDVDNTKAIEYLNKRLTVDGWDQEKYMAAYKLAQLYNRPEYKNSELRTDYLLQCTEIDPIRLESFMNLIRDAFDEGNYIKVLEWALMMPIMKDYEPDNRFCLESGLHNGHCEYLLSIFLYYCTNPEYPESVNKEILNLGVYYLKKSFDKVSPENKKHSLSNLDLYNKKLKGDQPENPNISVLLDHLKHSPNKDLLIHYLKLRTEPICKFPERYGSAMRLATFYDFENNSWKKQEYLIKATQIDPARIEPYYELARDAYSQNDINKAIAWCLMSPKNPLPAGRVEVNEELYKWKFNHWVSTIAFNSTDPIILQIGYNYLKQSADNLPSDKKQDAELKLELYQTKLAATTTF